MRAVFVIVDQPLISNGLDLFKVGEQMRIEHLGSIGSVKGLDEGILIWLAWLDISNGNAFGSSPLSERLRDQFGPIVQAYRIGRSIAVNQPTQDSDQARRRNRCADFDGQAFSVGLINDIQRAEPSPAVQGVVHEVQRPTAVRFNSQIQRLARPVWQPLLGAPRQM